MPELPEVECVRRSLERGIVRGFVEDAHILRRDVCEAHDASGRVIRVHAEHFLLGTRVLRVDRHGKQLAIVAENGRTLCIHLGMTGQVLITQMGETKPADHVHARWTIRANGSAHATHMFFRDPRRFGGLWAFDSFAHLLQHRWNLLGPDALTISTVRLRAGLRGRTCAIKAALLDQGTLAGVGNIYADEALFQAGIYPRIRAGRLADEQVELLAHCIRKTLAAAIDAGGSTLRDYRDATGSQGMYQSRHAVYGRAGLACLRCGSTLQSMVLAQRTAVYCSSCQPHSRPRPFRRRGT